MIVYLANHLSNDITSGNGGFTQNVLHSIAEELDDADALYMFAEHLADDPNRDLLHPGQSGYFAWQGNRDNTLYVNVFTAGHDTTDVPDRFDTTEDENMSILATKAAVHEIGHVLNIGEADDEDFDGDGNLDEVYSSGGDDPTIERQSLLVRRWSVMSAGSSSDQYLPPTNTTYFVFSIEELLTVSRNDAQIDE